VSIQLTVRARAIHHREHRGHREEQEILLGRRAVKQLTMNN